MRVETDGKTLDLVTSGPELLEGVGLLALLAVPFLLASSWVGFGLFVVTVFTAAVIHSAIRYS